MRVKASESERERLSIVLAETNFKVDALENDAAEGKDKNKIQMKNRWYAWIYRRNCYSMY